MRKIAQTRISFYLFLLIFEISSAQNGNTTTTSTLATSTSPPNATSASTSTSTPTSSETTPPPSTTTPPPLTTELPDQLFLHGEEIENFQADLSTLLPADYVPYQLPVEDASQFIPVFISLFFTSVADIDQQGGQISLDTHFARRWIDYKISKRITGPLKNITLGPEALDRIWKPDIYFDGTPSMEKNAMDATQKNVRVIFNTNDLKDAQIVFSERTRLKLDCSMEFHYYPADTQTCTYLLRSFSYKQSRLKLLWESPNSVFLQDPSHPNFDVLVESIWPNIAVNGTNKLFVEESFDPFRRGNYSAITFTIKARRKLSYHLVQTYLPSILLVLMTWLCFLLPTSMVEARIGISMTTVLTLTAMFASVREQAPSVSYTMAIDIWMVFCIFVVFVSLLLFTFIYWMKNRDTRANDPSSKRASMEDDEPDPIQTRKQYSLILRLTKYYAFIVFSFAFILFVIIYWWWLLTFSNYFGWNPSQAYNAVQEDNDDTGRDEPYFHFYRYLSEDASLLFNSEIYHPSARELLRKVFGLVH